MAQLLKGIIRPNHNSAELAQELALVALAFIPTIETVWHDRAPPTSILHKLEYTLIKHLRRQAPKRLQRSEFLTREPLFAVLSDREWNQGSIQTFYDIANYRFSLVDSLQERYSHKSLTDIERVYSSVYLTNAFLRRVCLPNGVSRKKRKPSTNGWIFNENVTVICSDLDIRVFLLAGLGF